MVSHCDTLCTEETGGTLAVFLESVIKEYVASSPDNRLTTFGNSPIFGEPLVGFADGDDGLFQDYKGIIGDFHLTPREALETQRQKGDNLGYPPRVSVISWALPITYETRLSSRRENLATSLRWNHTRWQGQEFINKLAVYLVWTLEELGCRAVAPELTDAFAIRELPDGRASNWSLRHIAYACGLGTFSLNDGFITPKGVTMRLGSVVTDMALPPSPRTFRNHLANCLYYRGGSCRRCIERCPAGAISERGHDRRRCQEFMMNEQPVIHRQLGRTEGYIGRYLGCGLCQTKVPCESMIPPLALKEK